MFPSRSLAAGLLLVALLGASLVPLAAVTAGDPDPCALAAAGLLAARDVAQDDAQSGRDAGDERADAVGLRNESYSWAYMDPVAHAHADAVDWYSFTLRGDGRTLVMVEVNATVGQTEEYLPVPPYYHIEAWAPGATAPTYRGTPNVHGGEALAFTDTLAGTWAFRVTRDPLAAADVPCAPAAAPVAEPPALPAEKPVANYGVYIGCEPICKAMTAGT